MAISVVGIVSFLDHSDLIASLFFKSSDTAFIASRGGWMYCDDSSVKPVDSKQVVVRIISSCFPPCFFSNAKKL